MMLTELDEWKQAASVESGLRREFQSDIRKLEQVIAVLRSGLRIISETSASSESMARVMRYEAQRTLNVAEMFSVDREFKE